MKRLLALLLILTNFLFLVGCATKIKDDFSVVTHIEITKYRTVWEEGDTEKILASVKLDKKEDSEDIEHICENLASLSLEKMNGNINVESSDKGSIFTISFKIATPEDSGIKKIKE